MISNFLSVIKLAKCRVGFKTKIGLSLKSSYIMLKNIKEVIDVNGYLM